MKTWALVAYRAGSDAAGKAAFFAVTLVAARRLSRDAFGLFSLGTTIGWIAAVATDFGIQLHLARRVARYPAAATAELRAWLRVRLATAAAALIAAAIVLAALRQPVNVAATMTVLTTAYVVNALVEFFFYFFRGLSRTDIESSVTLVQRGAMLLLAAAALWLRPDPLTVGIALLIPAIGALGYVWLRGHRLAAGIAANGKELSFPAAAPGFDRAPLDIGAVVPIGAGIVLSALYFRIDVLLIGAWIGTEAVAVYNAVFRLVEALRLLPAAMLAVALPSLCRATTREPLVRIATLVTAGGLIIAATLWAAAPWLVPMLYGGAYAEGVPVFRILLLAFPLMSLNYALTHQVIGWNGHRTYAAACAAALAVNVALNARWIPAMGIAGSAWATVATELVVTGGCAAFLTRRRSQTIVTGGALDLESPGVSI